jgi:molybdopterin synthase catalytic subunit
MKVNFERRLIELTNEVIDVGRVDRFLRDASVGGIALFIGTTREYTNGRQTAALSYESYSSMAIQEMNRLVDTAEERWSTSKVCLIHRLGVVEVAEASVVVGVATAHRSEAFEACRFLIDQLKVDVPIWKKESYVDGATAWVNDPLNHDER